MCCWHCRSYRLIIELCTCVVEGWAAWQCMTEFPSSGFAAQTGEGGKIKGWDEKEATDNELLGNAFSAAMPITRYKEAGRLMGVGIPQKLIQKKAIALLSSFQQPMRSLILFYSGH